MHDPPDDEIPSAPSGDGAHDQNAVGAGVSSSGGTGDPRASAAGDPSASGAGDPRASAAGDPSASGAGDPSARPYKLYRSAPRSLTARLRGETDADLEARADQLSRRRPAGSGALTTGPGGSLDGLDHLAADGAVSKPRRGWRRLPGLGGPRPWFHPIRLLAYGAYFAVCWVSLSVLLFVISASGDPGNLPGGNATKAALTSAGPILTSANNILVVGLDNRPKQGYSSGEPGANYSEAYANTDTLMIWRIGGGTSRRLSIPRDTLVSIPGCGTQKINAAWSCGGPKATIQAVEALTGVKINHMIVVDLGNFVKFIDDIGGVTVKTPLICSEISGGAADGGYTLDLSPGVHHLDGVDAVTLARTRENSCNAAYNDFSREKMQQQIMNAVKSQLFSIHAFIHLPWASWDAPKAIQTDMGPVSLMQLFAASEIGGSSAPATLGGSFGNYNGADVVIPPSQAVLSEKVQKLLNGN